MLCMLSNEKRILNVCVMTLDFRGCCFAVGGGGGQGRSLKRGDRLRRTW